MASSLPILTFHAIDDRPSVISYKPRVFQHGMAKLHENGYRTMSLLEAIDCLRQGKPFPDHSLVITFDDGYQTIYDEAFPVLQRYGMSATVFLIVGKKGRIEPEKRLPSFEGRSMLSWREIQEMQEWGINFGGHTLTHPDLKRLPFDQIKSEIYDSKTMIEDTLGVPVNCFAYPYGRYNHRIHELVKQRFACACSDQLDLITLGSDLYGLERIDAYYLRTERLFNVMLTGFFPSYIQMRGILRQIRRAVQPL